MEQLLEIARRKERLIVRCGVQRESIAATFRALQRPMSIVDRALLAARFLRAHPVLMVGVVAAVVAIRRRSVPLALAARTLVIWRTWRKVAAWAEAMGLNLRRYRGPGKG